MSDVHDVLVKARNLISDEKDWRKVGWGREHSPRCSHGAIVYAAGGYQRGHQFDYDAAKAATHTLERVVGECVITFNDAKERTHAEVLAAFDKAIAATAPTPDLSFLADVKVEAEAA